MAHDSSLAKIGAEKFGHFDGAAIGRILAAMAQQLDMPSPEQSLPPATSKGAMVRVAAKDFIDSYEHALELDFDRDGQPAANAPGFPKE